MVEGGVTFAVDIVDNVADATTKSIETSKQLDGQLKTTTDSAGQMTTELADGQKVVWDSVENTTSAVERQRVAMSQDLIAMMSLRRGLSGVTNGAAELGLVGDSTAKKFNKLNAAVGMVVGTFQLMKSATMIMNRLREAEIGVAAVETYRSILKNPAMLGVALAGTAAAGVAVGYFSSNRGGGGGGGSTTNNKTVNITFQGGATTNASSRGVARDQMDMMGG